MKTSTLLMSVLVVMGLILVGCGGPAASPVATQVPATSAPQAPAATQVSATSAPQAAACIKVGLSMASGEANSLDTINVPASEQAVYLNQVYQQLADLDSTFVVHPQLADSWESNAAATQWIFHLHKGVKFSDGRPFTAKDVVWTYKRLIDPAVKSEAAATLAFLNPEGIVATDDNTVTFTTANPVPELPLLITTKNTWIVPDGSTSDTLKLNGVGTGPFIPVGFQPVQQIHKFVRNPNYWEAGLPKSDCVEFYVITEATTRVAAIKTAQVDIVEAVDFSTIPSLQGDANIKLMETPASQSLTLSMFIDTPPYNDIRVRQAFKKLIDREAILKTALLGYGTIGDDNPIPPDSPYAWRSQVPPRDLEGAKSLLAAAGYSSSHPLKVDLNTADSFPGMLAMAQLFKEQAAEAGVQVNVITGEPTTYWDLVWMKQPFAESSWLMRGPGEGLALPYRSNSQYDETHWFRPDYDALLDKANATVDQNARTALYKQAEQMITEQGGVIIPVFMHMVAAMRTNCTGYVRHVRVDRFDLRNAVCAR